MTILPNPIPSQAIEAEFEKAALMNTFIAATLPSSFTEDENHLFSTISLHVLMVHEHQGAIAYLIRNGQFNGSALALLRPLAEAASRAHWLYACGTKDDLARVRAGKKLKTIRDGKKVDLTFREMAEQAEDKLSTGGLISSVVPFIPTLHELTHGGLAQLIRNVDAEGNIRPSHSEQDRIMALGSSTAQLTILTIAYGQLVAGGEPETASKQIGERFISLYPLTSTQRVTALLPCAPKSDRARYRQTGNYASVSTGPRCCLSRYFRIAD
jgi:hypothetical protein